MNDLRSLLAPELVEALEQLIDERVAAALAVSPMVDNGNRWLSVSEAGKLLGCSDRAIYERIRKGRIPTEAVKHSGRRVYVDRRELDRALERPCDRRTHYTRGRSEKWPRGGRNHPGPGHRR